MRKLLTIAAMMIGIVAAPANATYSPYNLDHVLSEIREGVDIARDYVEDCERNRGVCRRQYINQVRDVNSYIRKVSFELSSDRRTQIRVNSLLRLIVVNNLHCRNEARCERANKLLVKSIYKLIHDDDDEPPVSA